MAREWTIALIHEVFHGPDGSERLRACLRQARDGGATLAALPELPLNPWSPATREARAEDAEPPAGPRHRIQRDAARDVGIAVIGGAIVHDAADGSRRNRALLFDAKGELAASYDKTHLPSEPGFWESDHYEPGDQAARPVDGFPLSTGLQICSDLQRSQGSQLLTAGGAEAIFGPRATPPTSLDRWRLVIRANALTCAAYVISVNRPRPENGANIGGPSLAVDPDGEVIAESTDPVTLVRLSGEAVERARKDYPGYLAFRPDLYTRGWGELGDR
jgi:predicted amidohydrolase